MLHTLLAEIDPLSFWACGGVERVDVTIEGINKGAGVILWSDGIDIEFLFESV